MRTEFRHIKLLMFLTIVLSTLFSFGQYKKDYFIKPNSESLSKYRFDFSKIEKDLSFDEKANIFIEQIILEDTNALGFYANVDSYESFVNLRKNKKELYKSINAETHAKNVHVLDVNKDGKDDIIFNYLGYEAETAYIRLLLNSDTNYKSIRIPGHFIVNFSMKDSVVFETFGFACCGDPYRHYYFSSFRNDSLTKDKHVQIPYNLTYPTKIQEDGIGFYYETFAHETLSSSQVMTYKGKSIIVPKVELLNRFSTISDDQGIKHLVEIPLTDPNSKFKLISILAWVWWY